LLILAADTDRLGDPFQRVAQGAQVLVLILAG
jgi:hypothetical protein